MVALLFSSIYLALPAFAANMMPVIFARIHIFVSLDIPIDGGKMWRRKRILGDNKTWRGVVASILGAVVVVLIQYYTQLPLSISTVAFASLDFAFLYAVSVGFLVMLGDAIGSFIKRQLNFESGQPCIPLDQIDYIAIFILGTLAFTSWTVASSLLLIGATFFLNLGTNGAAYVVGIKKTYW